MLGAEVKGLGAEILTDRLSLIDLHATYRVGGTAPGGQPEERSKDHEPEHIEQELVVHRERAEDVTARRPRPGWDQPTGAEQSIDYQRGGDHRDEHQRDYP